MTHLLGRYQVSESESVIHDTQLPCKFRVASPSVDASLTTTCRPRAASTTPQRLAFPVPAGTQAFASLLHAPRRWQEVNIEFGIGEFNVENHPRRVLRNFERERGQDGFQI